MKKTMKSEALRMEKEEKGEMMCEKCGMKHKKGQHQK